MNANDLIAEYHKLEDWLKVENKRYDTHIAPVKARLQEIKDVEMRELLNAQGGKSIKTDSGTAYTSLITTPSIADREVYLDFIEERWEEHGNAMLQLGTPQVTAVKEYMEAHNGALPPGVKIATFTKININRS